MWPVPEHKGVMYIWWVWIKDGHLPHDQGPFYSELQLKVKSIPPYLYMANPVRANIHSHPHLLPQQQAQDCATTWGDPLSTQGSWQPMSYQHILCSLPCLQQSMANFCSALKVNMKQFPRQSHNECYLQTVVFWGKGNWDKIYKYSFFPFQKLFSRGDGFCMHSSFSKASAMTGRWYITKKIIFL